MEQIMRAINLLLQNDFLYSEKIVVYLTNDTIKQLVRRQVELGISDNENIDLEKIPVGYFAGRPVVTNFYNSVALVDDYNKEIVKEIRLSDTLF